MVGSGMAFGDKFVEVISAEAGVTRSFSGWCAGALRAFEGKVDIDVGI